MNTLTVPKIKDLVNKPTEQYKDMFAPSMKGGGGGGDTLTNTMTSELTAFLNDLKRDGTENNKAYNGNDSVAKAYDSVAKAYDSNTYDSNAYDSNAYDSNAY
jgi:hypothetical protein